MKTYLLSQVAITDRINVNDKNYHLLKGMVKHHTLPFVILVFFLKLNVAVLKTCFSVAFFSKGLGMILNTKYHNPITLKKPPNIISSFLLKFSKSKGYSFENNPKWPPLKFRNVHIWSKSIYNTRKHHQTTFPASFWPYNRFLKNWNVDPKLKEQSHDMRMRDSRNPLFKARSTAWNCCHHGYLCK